MVKPKVNWKNEYKAIQHKYYLLLKQYKELKEQNTELIKKLESEGNE